MGRYHVSIRFDSLPRLPAVGPKPPQYAIAAFACMSTFGSRDSGYTTLTLTVEADDELHARVEAHRLGDMWALLLSISDAGTIERVAEALEQPALVG